MRCEPVLLDLNAIVQKPGATGNFTYSVHLPTTDALVCEGPVGVSLQVHNTASALLVRGKVRGRVHLACGRCLEDVPVEIEEKIEEQFSLPGGKGRNLQLIDQIEPKEAAFTDQVLDVTELVRQRMLLALPLRVLCDEACKGLCSACGQNLNVKQCDCPEMAAHPAWEALRSLKEKRKE